MPPNKFFFKSYWQEGLASVALSVGVTASLITPVQQGCLSFCFYLFIYLFTVNFHFGEASVDYNRETLSLF